MRKKDAGRNRIRNLGFESVDSLRKALRLDCEGLESALESCSTGYPYTCWYEPKRSGNGQRLIEHPLEDLKEVQKRVNRLLQRLDLPDVFHGCFSGTSIVTNALPHCGPSWFLTFDLANYYKTIRPHKVYDGLRGVGASPDVARVLTRLSTIKGRVPQGAPTSPMVAAIAMLRLASRLQQLAGKLGARASVYGDNVSLSGPRTLVGHKCTILSIAKSEGFRVRPHKTQTASPQEEKLLPGLLVRGGKITLYDEDFERVSRALDACLALGSSGLARKVCARFVHKLRGLVNHYIWIDPERMACNSRKFDNITWPEKHLLRPCWSPRCHCSPMRDAVCHPVRVEAGAVLA